MVQALAAPVHLFDYLAFEDASVQRHEYVGGRIHAMTAMAYGTGEMLPAATAGLEPLALDALYAGTDIAS